MPPKRRKKVKAEVKAEPTEEASSPPPAAASSPSRRSNTKTTTNLKTEASYELKYGSLEVVLAVADLKASSPQDKFYVGRLQDDVLRGMEEDVEVTIQWFEPVEKNSNKETLVFEEAEDDLDLLQVGSLVCSITKYAKESFARGKDMLNIAKEAWEYGEKKLSEQLEDDYNEDDDSQFGDGVVSKRLKLVAKAKKQQVIHIDDDSSDDGDDDNDEDDGGGKKKKRKRKAGKKKGEGGSAAKKKKSTTRGLTPRPKIKVEDDSFAKKTGRVDDFDGDVERASKEVFRAVQAKDTKALKAAATGAPRNKVFSLHYVKCLSLPVTPLMQAMVQGNKEAFKLLLNDMKPVDPQDGADINNNLPSFGKLQKCALPTLSTGKISGRHAKYNRVKVGASRGGREGNNALLYDANGEQYATHYVDMHTGRSYIGADQLPFEVQKYGDEHVYMNLFRDFEEVPDDLLDLAEATYHRTFHTNSYWAIDNMIRGGQRRVAHRYIEAKLKIPYDEKAYNIYHLESLQDTPADEIEDKKKPFSKKENILAKSVIKQAGDTETRFTPLACACINPQVCYLEALLTAGPEHATHCDQKDTSLLHYAAACDGTAPLEYLIQTHQLPRNSADKRKELPLHFAARAARPDNCRLLLQDLEDEQRKTMWLAKTSEGFAPIHYAARSQRAAATDTVRALLEQEGFTDPNLPTSAPRNKVTPVHIAAGVGNLEMLRMLVEEFGANCVKGDKLGRSPLMHACRNGHAPVVSYLLKTGVPVDVGDSSQNHAVLYAAAYGWDDCLQLLLDAGAQPDTKNSWKTSALSVSIQKGHCRVSTLLLKLPGVDVNFKDDDGKSLLFRLMEGFLAETLLKVTHREESSDDSKKTNQKNKAKKAKTKKDDDDKEEIAKLCREMPWALQKLLEREDVDLSSTDDDGRNLLHVVCAQKYPEMSDSAASSHLGEKGAVTLVKLVLSRSKEVDLNAGDADGVTPLLLSASHGNSLLLDFLIQKGASLSADAVDKDGKNVCHYLLQSSSHKDQLELVEKMAGKDTFHEMLKTADSRGFNPIHNACRTMVSEGNETLAKDWHKLLSDFVKRFPDLATVPVGPICMFKDPDYLAEMVLDEENDEDENQYNYHWNRRNQSSGPSVLDEAKRGDPAKVKKALKKHNQAIPLVSEHFGKSLIHFICECKHAQRLKDYLEWIVPVSADVVDAEAGTGTDVYTPLQTLVYKTLTANSILHGNDKDRLASLNLILESVKVLLKGGADDVDDINRRPGGLFASRKDRAEKAKKELTEEVDTENMKTVKRCAERIIQHNDNTARGEIVGLFEKAMAARTLWVSAKVTSDDSLSDPVPHTLAKSGWIPEEIWSALIKDFALDLTQEDEDGATVLHFTLKRDNTYLSKFLCQECPELVTKANRMGERPIHVVAKLDNARMVELVLGEIEKIDGVDVASEVNRGDKMGRTAFHFSVEKAAGREGEPLEPCEILFLRAGARLDIPDGINRRTPLHYCFLENASSQDHFNFPHSLSGAAHDRVDLASSLLAAKGANESVSMEDKFGRTALSYAAAYNSTVSSLLLVSKGSDLFHQDQDGNTACNIATLRGFGGYTITMLKSVASDKLPKLVDVVDIRREKRKDDETGMVAIRVTKREVHSIVWHAIKQNLRGLVYILLDTSFPLHTAAIDALSLNSFQLVRKLLTTSSLEVIRHVDPETGRNLLHEVARVERYDNSEWSTTLAEILLSAGVKADSTSKQGSSPLHIAASKGHLELVRLLVKTDKKMNLMFDNDGFIPLHRFMASGRNFSEYHWLEFLQLLSTGIKSLSDPKFNKIPRLEKNMNTFKYDGIEFELGPNKETVREEIDKQTKTSDANKPPKKKTMGYTTLLIQALYAGRHKVVQALLDNGAPIDLLDSNGLACVHHMVMQNNVDALTLLLRNNADPDLCTKDKRCVSPLILASFQSGVTPSVIEVAKVLIRSGANVLQTCKETGATALHFACRENNLEFAELILRGALHATVTERKGKAGKGKTGKSKAKKQPPKSRVLAKIGSDCALFGGTKDESKNSFVLLHPETTFPASFISEACDMNGLDLDSKYALLKLHLKKTGQSHLIKDLTVPRSEGGGNDKSSDTKAQDEQNSSQTPGSGLFGDNGDGNNDEEQDEEDDEEDDEESSDDGDSEGGSDGGLFDRDDDDDEPQINQNPSNQSKGIAASEQALLRFFGAEPLLLGEKDKNLTNKLRAGDPVIVQSRTAKTHATCTSPWMEGKICGVHGNGTYDVDVFRGLVWKGVSRQQIRPWGGAGRPVTDWPSKAGKTCKVLRKLLETKDKTGYSPIMATIKPVHFGSYERCKMVDLLVEHGAEVDEKALSLARPGSDFFNHLQSISESDSAMPTEDGVDEPVRVLRIPAGLEPIDAKDLEEETKNSLIELETRGLMKKKQEPPKINPVCELKGVRLRVLPVVDDDAMEEDSATPDYYDVVMTKCEVHQGGYSENKYYKMSIIEDKTKGLFVLLTNWGQIGDDGGQKQETPFGSQDEAVSEFKKVFKSKSANVWDEYITGTFEPKLGKYKPVKILASGYEKPKLPDLASMLDNPDDNPDVVRDSRLGPDLQETMRSFVDPAAINAAVGQLGLQEDKLPLGRVSVEALFEAEQKLLEVEKALEIVSKLTKPEELKEKRAANDQVSILSSEFFQMLPTKEGEEALKPLNKHSLKEQRNHILNLKNLSVASAIVNTAFVKSTETNPLDYAYRCLRSTLSVLSKSTPERIGIEQYFRNTCRNNDLVISQVYQLDRHDETSNKSMKNHRLLWHGTNRANVMGVIKEGLRVAPPQALVSGNAFGDGVYFADMASKSWPYCRADLDRNAKVMPTAYLFLADVALGKQDHVFETNWGDKPGDESADSVWAVGYEGPNVDKDVVFHKTGATAPLGNVVRSPSFHPKSLWRKNRWDSLDKTTCEAIETARSSSDTQYPVRIKTTYQSNDAEVVLDHGPFSDVATVVPIKVRKVSEESKDANTNKTKKRKSNRGEAVEDEDDEEEGNKSDEDDDGGDEDDVQYEETFREFDISRHEQQLNSCVHYNEFVVADTKRINLKYLVEVTSRGWLEQQAKNEAKKKK